MTYYEVLVRRHPHLPQDVLQAMYLFERDGLHDGLLRLSRLKGPWWQSVRVNLKRMPLPWDLAVQVLR